MKGVIFATAFFANFACVCLGIVVLFLKPETVQVHIAGTYFLGAGIINFINIMSNQR